MNDDQSRLQHILDVTGLELREFASAFGTQWHEDVVEGAWNADEDPDGEFVGWPSTPWHLGGSPVQLMLQAFDHGVFAAHPKATWRDWTVSYEPGDRVYVSTHEIRHGLPEGDPHAKIGAVKQMLRRRRASFRRCRYCWELTPPEFRFDSVICTGCATQVEGVVF